MWTRSLLLLSKQLQLKHHLLRGLVNVLKSLASWEKSMKESHKRNNSGVCPDGEISSKEFDGSRSGDDSTYNFERLQDQNFTIEAGVYEFNRHPVKGMQRLISSQLVENTPSSAAQFLQNTPNLDKAMIGEYIPKEYSVN